MNRRDVLRGALVLSMGGVSAVLAWPAAAQVRNMHDAINKAGRQRMLSQRVAKAYLQLGLGVDVDQSKKILDQSLATFDRQLVELKNFTTTAEIKTALIAIEKTWSDFKDLSLGKEPNQLDAKQILRLSEVLLNLTNQVTQQLENHANSKGGKLVNISGRQRMLSQRMAKMYQSLQWEVGDAGIAQFLESDRREFNNNMSLLEANPSNTKAIEQELKFARQQWAFFDHALRQTPDVRMRHRYATTVATTSERILQQMDIVTGLYQDLH